MNLINGLLNINLMYLSIVGMVVGIILGSRINTKMNISFYLISGVIIAYLLGAFPYYNFPVSYAFILSIVGVLIGNIINRVFKR